MTQPKQQKLSRAVLKQIVKECLAEILAEGLGTSLNEAIQRQPKTQSTIQPQQRIQNPTLVEAVQKASGGNEIFANILADTATTSLQTMLHSDPRFASDSGGLSSQHLPYTVEHNTSQHQKLDEPSQSNWERLAFMDAPKRTMPQ